MTSQNTTDSGSISPSAVDLVAGRRLIKVKLAWAVLRGRPVAYRMHFDGKKGIVFGGHDRIVIVDCMVSNTETLAYCPVAP
jgi:hypothetical protein